MKARGLEIKVPAAAASLLLLALLATSCTPAAGSVATCPSTITIQDFAFSPPSCQVAAGTTLTFVNRDSAPHTATTTAGAPVTFDTGTLQQGGSATVTLAAPGTYPYHCSIHPSMTGSITVTGSAGEAAPNTRSTDTMQGRSGRGGY